jgi:uncharacterized repeat protein (TIGR01451 family)
MRSKTFTVATSIAILAFASSAAAAAVLPVGPDLSISISDSGGPFDAGSLITYTLEYENSGEQAASGVLIMETVPDNTVYQASSSTPGWSCADESIAGTPCLFDLGGLPASTDGTLEFSVEIVDPLPGDVTEISNTATIADDGSHGPDPVPDNNWATVDVAVGEGDPGPGEEVCHPVAQRIADAVNSLGPDGSSYTCEDILDMFNGSLTDAQLGFGRMLHAYHLAAGRINLPWEIILEWHLGGNGWGKLLLLNRLAEELEGYSIEDLIALLEGDFAISRIRLALVIVDRFGFTFEDVFNRLTQHSTSPAKAMLFFMVAHETGFTFDELDDLMDAGYSLPKIRQAFRLAGGNLEVMMQILEMGVAEYQKSQRDQEATSSQTQVDPIERTAAKIAAQYSVNAQLVEDVFYGTCQQNWPCVRAYFRDLGDKPGNDRPEK